MKKLEKIFATILFMLGGLGLVTDFGLAEVSNYQLFVIALAVTFALLGILCLPYGYVRRANLRYTPANSKDRTSPPGQFIMLGWGMLAFSIIMLGFKLFWLH
jgi:uncharacterized membrane protein YidH (DUF202 family)